MQQISFFFILVKTHYTDILNLNEEKLKLE